MKTRTYTKDMSARYMSVYADIPENSSMSHRIGDVNPIQFSLFDAKGAYSRIKSALFHGCVPSKTSAKPGLPCNTGMFAPAVRLARTVILRRTE